MHDLTINLIAETLFLIGLIVLGYLWKKFNILLKKKNPQIPTIALIIFFVTWVSTNLLVLFLTRSNNQTNVFFIVYFLLSAAILFYIFYKQVSPFWFLGISGADSNITKGIDFTQSLKLCKHQLDFMGIGAGKLTKASEFEAALVRCCKNRPIRFLLCKPDDINLASAAKRAGKSTEEYRDIVMESLTKIANLKKRRDINIEVRYYSDKPIWRLMFINESICLVSSYSDFGSSDGTDLPQVHIVKLEDNYPKSFFHAFELYFEKQWDEAAPWDFKAYI